MRQICVYAQATARISPLIPRMSQKLLRPATRNARPSTYSRLVPQSPKSSAPAWNQLTFRGRSPESSVSAGGLISRPLVVESIKGGPGHSGPTDWRAGVTGLHAEARLERRGPAELVKQGRASRAPARAFVVRRRIAVGRS